MFRFITLAEIKAVFVVMSVVVISGAAILAIWWPLASTACAARWPDREHYFGIMAGCMVQSDTKEWINETRIRTLN